MPESNGTDVEGCVFSLHNASLLRVFGGYKKVIAETNGQLPGNCVAPPHDSRIITQLSGHAGIRVCGLFAQPHELYSQGLQPANRIPILLLRSQNGQTLDRQ